MALYLVEGDSNDNLLGLSCHHVLMNLKKEANIEYIHYPGAPQKEVLLLGKRAFTNFINLIRLRIGGHGTAFKRWKRQIEGFEEREKDTNAIDVEKAKAAWIKTQELLDKAERQRGHWEHFYIGSTMTRGDLKTTSLATSSAPQPSPMALVRNFSQKTGQFSRLTRPSLVMASRAIRWISPTWTLPRHFDINNIIEDCFFPATSSLSSPLCYLLLSC